MSEICQKATLQRERERERERVTERHRERDRETERQSKTERQRETERSPSKMMKNHFYLILKAHFVLNIFRFLSRLFCSFRK